jgi:hypothetical protein
MKYLKALRSRFKPKACGNQNLQFGELTMAKPDFSKIPASKEASPRQISAIANRFAKLTNPEDSWMLTKKYTAVLYRFQKESGKNLTHGDIQKFFKVSKVPKNFSDLLSTAEETPKESPKPSKKAPTKTSTKSSKTPPKVSEASELKALKKQVADLTAAVQLLLKNS